MKTRILMHNAPKFWICAFLFFVMACTPKVGDTVAEEKAPEPSLPEPKKKIEDASDCVTFGDIRNGEEMKQNYVVYRDFFKLGKYEEGFPYWEQVYEKAPAADGRRWTVYGDGIVYYEYMSNKAEDDSQKKAYVDRVFELYDELVECYPEQELYVKARKGFDYYYKYPDRKTDLEKYQMFRDVIDDKGSDTPVFVINPFTGLLYNLYLEDEISMNEARKYALLIPDIISDNISKGEEPEAWDIVRNFAPKLLERFEAVRGFYDCAYFMEKYYDRFDIADCEDALSVYSKLRFGGCEKDDQKMVAMYAKLIEGGCIKESAPGPASVGRDCLANGDYDCAVEQFEKAARETDDIDKKATYLLLVAKVYYAHLKNYPKSRQYARQAAQVKSGWGEPYLLIGKLYASSGPICGPGRGFDSQIVTWPAIDKWNYAKSIDPSVSAEANKLIASYTQFMPSTEDIFQRGLQEGSTFRVECWIQENTKIRTAPR